MAGARAVPLLEVIGCQMVEHDLAPGFRRSSLSPLRTGVPVHASDVKLRQAVEPVDLMVNGKLIARGEVVVIDENYGIRITTIISQLDRVNKLQ